MSKAKRKTKDKSKDLLAQLQSSIDSTSINEAMKAIKYAQQEIELLKQQQAKAKNEVDIARSAVGNMPTRENSAYNSSKYWDDRFATEKIFEWYLDFEELKPLLVSSIESVFSNAKDIYITIAGCGNSLLCEDLWSIGYRKVIGLDYSRVVVDSMKDRLVDKPWSKDIKYAVADLTKIASDLFDSCDVLIDKGTLDAITSGDRGGDTDMGRGGSKEDEGGAQGSVKAISYLKNIWKMLRNGGVCILVSTMPPSLLSMLMVSHKDMFCISPFPACHTAVKTSSQSGEVHFYCLRKEISRPSNMLGGGGSASIIPDNVKKLVEETQAVLKELATAREKVEEQDRQARKVAKELQDAEENVSNLSKKLNPDWMESVFQEDEPRMGGDDSATSREAPSDVITLKEPSKPPPPPTSPILPKVNLSIELLDGDGSDKFIAGGEITALFCIQEGDWDEDDFIAVEDYSFVEDSLVSQSQFDCFEYTSQPVKASDCTMRGRVVIKLPDFGGEKYRLVYNRSSLDYSDTTSPLPKRINWRVAVSDSFSFKFQAKLTALSSPLPSMRSPPPRLGSRRPIREFTLTTFSSVAIIVEDMSNIRSYCITVSGDPSCSGRTKFSKVAAWLTLCHNDKPSSLGTGIVVTFEFDVATLQQEWGSVTTDSFSLYLPLDASSSFPKLSESTFGSVEGGRIILQIPYGHSHAMSSRESSAQHNVEHINAQATVACKFCQTSLLQSNSVLDRVTQLPSGLFENMMHTFLCSEDCSSVPLLEGDIDVLPGSLLVGDIYVALSASDIKPTAFLFCCKECPGIIDAAIGQSSFLHVVAGDGESPPRKFIDVSTCSVNCSRCKEQLGDASMSNTLQTDLSSSLEFTATDLSSIRLLRDKVSISSNVVETFMSAKSCEQVLAATLERLAKQSYYVTELYVSDGYVETGSAHAQRHVGNMLSVRVMRTGRVCVIKSTNGSDSPAVHFNEAIKVSVNFQGTKRSASKLRFSIEFEDYCEVVRLLHYRAEILGSSLIDGETTSFLLL